jgi:hypothetical protein
MIGTTRRLCQLFWQPPGQTRKESVSNGIEANVSDELLWDESIRRNRRVRGDGVVTLRGTVGSFRMKRGQSRTPARVRRQASTTTG